MVTTTRDPILGLTPQEFDAWLAGSRGRQGKPFHVRDPAILASVAATVHEAIRDGEARASQPDDLAEAA